MTNNILLSMKGRQVLIDIGVVLALPALFLLGSYLWSPSEDTALLSLVAPPQAELEFGAKAKAALDDLRSITPEDDAKFFESQEYKSLQEFHVDIPPTTLGRTYPFTAPDAVRAAAAAKSR